MKSKTGATLLLLFVIPFIFFFPYIFHSPQPLILPNSTLGTDLTREILPTSVFIQQELIRWHQIPLWRPYILSGAPLAGHPVYPLFYPPYWIIAVLPIPLALNLLVVLHLGWAAAGTFLFLRQVNRISDPAAIAGAMIFGFSPRIIAYVSGGHWSMIMAIAWLPWVWLMFFQYWRTEKWKWAVLLGVCSCLQVLTDLRTFYITLLPLLFLSIAYIKKPFLSWLLKSIKIWGVSGVLALGLSAGQVFPFIELLFQSTRTTLSFEEASAGSLHPAFLVGILYPPNLYLPELYVYMGAGALVFSFIAITSTARKEIKPFLFLLLFAIIISFGSYTPLYKALYTLIPGFSFLRVPARWSIVVVFLLASLAGFGIDSWIKHGNEIRKKKNLILTVLGIFYLAGFIVHILLLGNFPYDPVIACVEFVLIGILLIGDYRFWKPPLILVVILFGLWIPAKWLLQPISADFYSTGVSSFVKILENGAMEGDRSFAPFGYGGLSQAFFPDLFAADGYDSFHIRAYQDFVEKMIGCDYTGYSVSIPAVQSNPAAAKVCPAINLNQNFAKLLNIRFLILPEDLVYKQGTILAVENGMNLIDLGKGYGTAFGIHEVRFVSSQQCLEELDRVDLQKTGLVEEPLQIKPEGGVPKVIDQALISNGIQFHVNSETPFMLIRSETWAPGWKAFDEQGHQLEVFRADCTFQGVMVEQGEHTIRFEYRPTLLIVGICVSCVFATAVIMLLLLFVFRQNIIDFLLKRS